MKLSEWVNEWNETWQHNSLRCMCSQSKAPSAHRKHLTCPGWHIACNVNPTVNLHTNDYECWHKCQWEITQKVLSNSWHVWVMIKAMWDIMPRTHLALQSWPLCCSAGWRCCSWTPRAFCLQPRTSGSPGCLSGSPGSVAPGSSVPAGTLPPSGS